LGGISAEVRGDFILTVGSGDVRVKEKGWREENLCAILVKDDWKPNKNGVFVLLPQMQK
jgi:hypothetical protein